MPEVIHAVQIYDSMKLISAPFLFRVVTHNMSVQPHLNKYY